MKKKHIWSYFYISKFLRFWKHFENSKIIFVKPHFRLLWQIVLIFEVRLSAVSHLASQSPNFYKSKKSLYFTPKSSKNITFVHWNLDFRYPDFVFSTNLCPVSYLYWELNTCQILTFNDYFLQSCGPELFSSLANGPSLCNQEGWLQSRTGKGQTWMKCLNLACPLSKHTPRSAVQIICSSWSELQLWLLLSSSDLLQEPSHSDLHQPSCCPRIKNII